jgi:hypothetical protein
MSWIIQDFYFSRLEKKFFKKSNPFFFICSIIILHLKMYIFFQLCRFIFAFEIAILYHLSQYKDSRYENISHFFKVVGTTNNYSEKTQCHIY